MIFIWLTWAGNFWLDTHNPDHLISISIHLIWGSIKTIPFHIFILVFPPLIKAPFNPLTGYYYYAGYRIQIILICRLTKDRDQALISISTIQKLRVQEIPPVFLFFQGVYIRGFAIGFIRVNIVHRIYQGELCTHYVL